MDTPLNIDFIYGESLCDSNSRDCGDLDLVIVGTGFLVDQPTMCHITREDNDVVTVPASVTSDTSVTCSTTRLPVHPWENIGISITRFDGTVSSNSVQYTVYDSRCIECAGNPATCAIQRTKCYIENQCWERDVKGSKCQICNPDDDNEDWTEIEGCTDGPETWVVALAATLGVAAVGVAIIVTVRWSRKPKGSSVTPEPQERSETESMPGGEGATIESSPELKLITPV